MLCAPFLSLYRDKLKLVEYICIYNHIQESMPSMNKFSIKSLFQKDTSFANLMQKRIYNVLLIASKYDSFMLEDDGRIDEKLFTEYASLSLHYPPRFTQVTTREEAEMMLIERHFDLVIVMPNDPYSDFVQAGDWIKSIDHEIPVILLTPFSKQVSRSLENADLTNIDYVFSWLGNTELLLAIIKLIEDKMNAIEDVRSVGVQVILLVEDSVRFYSSILPIIYKIVLQQSQIFSKEALNDHQQTLRMRGRPKILMARNYEEAIEIYNQYSDNILGVISDVTFAVGGKLDKEAGLKFARYIRDNDPYVPMILQSSDLVKQELISELGATFVDKNSKKLPVDVKEEILANFGFGDFIVRDVNTGEELARVHDLIDFQNKLFNLPKESLIYHASRNHISRWFYSRAMFPLAEFIRSDRFLTKENYDNGAKAIFDAIVQYRRMKNKGIVAVFHPGRYDQYSNFARIGDGSMGGKGRGLAFIDSIIKRHPEIAEVEDIPVAIPKTVVICTDIFDDFMESNKLYQIALSDAPDQEILDAFLNAEVPVYLVEDLLVFFKAIDSPVAIRSSSLLEDSHYQPFAGIYSTYMIPCIEDKEEMIDLVCNAIKAVYASVYYKDSKSYMIATSNVIDQEKMAIVLQSVVGNSYDMRYYPSFSGVARSLNFYPINNEKPEDGIVNLAFGLGKYIVDGGVTLHVSPKHPHNILQMSTLDLALRDTQTKFYALDLCQLNRKIEMDDSFNLLQLPIKEAEKDGSLRFIASTYDPNDQIIRDGLFDGGRKVISFANILQHDKFPLATILNRILEEGAREMARPVEIEFAVNLNDRDNEEGVFYWLQIRPIVNNSEIMNDDLSLIPESDLMIASHKALGHGVIDDVCNVIYVKSENFNASNNQLIAYDIEKFNRTMIENNIPYILIGPGRWGSSDPWLGIPVKWPHISGSKLIVETNISSYQIEPSQGTHFFQNLTSLGVAYFTVDTVNGDDILDQKLLDSMPAVEETKFIRRIRFDASLSIKVDGKKNIGVVMRPPMIEG